MCWITRPGCTRCRRRASKRSGNVSKVPVLALGEDGLMPLLAVAVRRHGERRPEVVPEPKAVIPGVEMPTR